MRATPPDRPLTAEPLTTEDVACADRYARRYGRRGWPGCEPDDLRQVALLALARGRSPFGDVVNTLRKDGPVRRGDRDTVRPERAGLAVEIDAPISDADPRTGHDLYPSSAPDPSEVSAASDLAARLRALAARLPTSVADARPVFDALLDGEPAPETAARLGVRTDSIYRYRTAMRHHLRAALHALTLALGLVAACSASAQAPDLATLRAVEASDRLYLAEWSYAAGTDPVRASAQGTERWRNGLALRRSVADSLDAALAAVSTVVAERDSLRVRVAALEGEARDREAATQRAVAEAVADAVAEAIAAERRRIAAELVRRLGLGSLDAVGFTPPPTGAAPSGAMGAETD